MSTGKLLHIVCFDVPYPADYGGAMESFYKIKSLHAIGVKIYLHCFVYGDRKPQEKLEQYAEKVYYYPRVRNWKYLFSSRPFIVASRMPEALLANLCAVEAPVLFDATHTTGFLDHSALQHRKKIVRLHNIEWIYYNTLFRSAVSWQEYLYFFSEYKKLRKYDATLINADVLSCLSKPDYEYYAEKFPDKKVTLQYVFHENTAVSAVPGKGNYILYHGNLSILDNYKIVMDWLDKYADKIPYPMVVAGKNPPEVLVRFLQRKNNVRLVANPDSDALATLVREAQICLAIAANPSGIKLKLINSMYQGRFIFSNPAAFEGSGLEEEVIAMDENTDVAAAITAYMAVPFTESHLEKRKAILSALYDNLQNANALWDEIEHA